MSAFIAYYRVSTDRPGQSGLGLEAQREAVTREMIWQRTKAGLAILKRRGVRLAMLVDVRSGHGAA